MPTYEATASADLSGYTTSVQQAIAVTKEYAAANDGMIGTIGRLGTRAIVGMNDALGVQEKLMKANVSEAANYQQALGGISASARAMNKDVEAAARTTKSVARNLTGDMGSAVATVNQITKFGVTDTKGISGYAKAITNLSAATGESGGQIVSDLRTMSRAFDTVPDVGRITALGDSITTTSAKFGASASSVSGFSKEIAPFAKQIGMAQTSVIGFSTAFSRMGEDGYRSANVFSRVLSDIDQAVREGTPTLGVYADAMGMSYANAEKLAKANPTEFVVTFTEALNKQGTAAVRTLEALGLEGVRTKKSLAALVAGGDLRDIIATSQAAYGSGSTGEAAKEQLNGLNEEAAKFQESLRQVAANSGEPMLDFLTKITSLSQSAASGLAKVTDSELFKTVFSGVGMAMFGGGLLAKGASIAVTGGSIGQGIGMLGALPGARAGTGFLRQNARMLGLAGAGATAAGMLSGNSMLGTAGQIALLGGVLGSERGFGAARKGIDWMTSDAMSYWTTPFNKWGSADRGSQWRLSQDPKGLRRLTTAAEFDTSANRFRATGSVTQGDELLRYMKATPDTFSKDEISKVRTALRKVRPDGTMAAAPEVAAALTSIRNRGSIDPGFVTRNIGNYADDAAFAAQSVGARARNLARRAPLMAGQVVSGFGVQGAALLANPVGLAVAGTALAAGGAAYAAKRSNELEERMASNQLNAEKVAEGYGLLAPTFEGIVKAGDAVTSSFERLSSVVSDSAKAGGTFNLSPGEYAGIQTPQGAPFGSMDFQNYRIGPQTVGRQRTDAAAIAELIANYGAIGTTENSGMLAAALTDLKAAGKDVTEVNAVVDEWKKRTATDAETVGTIMTAMTTSQGMFGNDTAQNAMKNWVAGSGERLTGEQQVATIVDELTKRSETMTQDQVNLVLEQLKATPGMENFSIPTITGGRQPLMSTASATAGAGPINMGTPTTPTTTNEARAEEFKKSLGPVRSELESSMTAAFGAASTDDTIMARMAAAARRAAEASVPERQAAMTQGDRINALYGRESTSQDALLVGLGGATTQAISGYREGATVANRKGVDTMLLALDALNSGDTSKNLTALRDIVLSASAESATGKVGAMALSEVERQRGVEISGMDPFAAIRARAADAQAKLTQAEKALATSGESGEAQAQWEAAYTEVADAREAEIGFMQQFLKAKRDFDRSMSREEEDYQQQRAYTITDYNDSVAQNTEAFYRQQAYAAQDYHTSMSDMATDYRTSMARAERDYNKSRERTLEDQAKVIKRRAEDAAESMYDPFTRMAREQTWSGAGLLDNLAKQTEAFSKQAAQLNELRKAGVNQSVIDTLGLNDPGKAQQLDRLLRDINAGGAAIATGLNEHVANRVQIGGQLFGATNDKDARREQEDFQTGLDRMAKDRKTWLADAEADYAKTRSRARRAFNRAMERAQESFETSMKWMERAHNKALGRMETQHTKTRKRAEEDFNATFEGVTSQYDKLADATTKALKGETPKWSDVVTDGVKGMRKTFEKESNKLDEDMAGMLSEAVTKRYGGDSKVLKSMLELIAAVAAGSTGGPSTPGPWTTPGQDTSAGGSLMVTGGKGRFSQPYGKRNPRYAAGYHTGTDISVPIGTPLYATQTGEIVLAGRYGAYGNAVMIQDADESVRLLYGHMSSVSVRVGQQVRRGQNVGRSGNTGQSTGPHVHVEARRRPYGYSNNTNPRAWMSEGGIAQSPVDATVGESVYPEAIIPLNHRGVDVLAQALRAVFDSGGFHNALGMGGAGAPISVVYQTTEDHSVNVTGPVEVTSNDPDRVLRVIEAKARQRALIQPAVRR